MSVSPVSGKLKSSADIINIIEYTCALSANTYFRISEKWQEVQT